MDGKEDSVLDMHHFWGEGNLIFQTHPIESPSLVQKICPKLVPSQSVLWQLQGLAGVGAFFQLPTGKVSGTDLFGSQFHPNWYGSLVFVGECTFFTMPLHHCQSISYLRKERHISIQLFDFPGRNIKILVTVPVATNKFKSAGQKTLPFSWM